jgi:hypothetical protein
MRRFYDIAPPGGLQRVMPKWHISKVFKYNQLYAGVSNEMSCWIRSLDRNWEVIDSL